MNGRLRYTPQLPTLDRSRLNPDELTDPRARVARRFAALLDQPSERGLARTHSAGVPATAAAVDLRLAPQRFIIRAREWVLVAVDQLVYWSIPVDQQWGDTRADGDPEVRQ